MDWARPGEGGLPLHCAARRRGSNAVNAGPAPAFCRMTAETGEDHATCSCPRGDWPDRRFRYAVHPQAEAGVYVGIGIPAPVVVAPRVVVPAYYGPRVVVGYPRVGYPRPYGWGYGGWRYGYHGYGRPGWGYGGGYHYHR